MIIFLLWAILLILFWPIALLIALGWFALLILRIGFGITVFAVKVGVFTGVGGAMAGASMLQRHGRRDQRSPEVIEWTDRKNWHEFKRRMNQLPSQEG
jgi:hypothetical protein